ncbi:MAG: poly-gamma-glutamate system protein [Myxococcota bacterium]
MQRLYWRQAHVSRVVHVLVAVIAAGALFAAERFQQVRVEPDFEIKRAAAQRMERGMELLRNHRVRRVAPVDAALDPTGSGMIGVASSSTTTNAGSLAAKRTTANPNWAAAMIDLLRRAGVEPGDAVAIGVSGSFPALNLAAYVAVEEMGLEAVAISSAGASSFGANLPGLTWLDMERLLAAAEITRTRSVAASLGGTRDQALGMQDRGRRQLRAAIDRNDVAFIDVDTEQTSIDQRMELYDTRAEGRRFAAYINVGGSLVSIGPKSVKRLYRAGVNLRPHPRGTHIDSVMMRFLNDTIPVINLSKVVPLAESYGLPVEPESAPRVGEGAVFEKRTHDRRLVGALVVGLLAASFALLRLDWGARLVELGGGGGSKLERMV